MAMFEGGVSAWVSYDESSNFTLRHLEHKESISAIFVAGIDALDAIKVKTPFSLKKSHSFAKAKKKLIKFKEMSQNEKMDVYNIVDSFYHEFEELETNKFSGRQKEFAYSLNNLMLKIKNDLTATCESFIKREFKPTDRNRKGYGGFYFE